MGFAATAPVRVGLSGTVPIGEDFYGDTIFVDTARLAAAVEKIQETYPSRGVPNTSPFDTGLLESISLPAPYTHLTIPTTAGWAWIARHDAEAKGVWLKSALVFENGRYYATADFVPAANQARASSGAYDPEYSARLATAARNGVPESVVWSQVKAIPGAARDVVSDVGRSLADAGKSALVKAVLLGGGIYLLGSWVGRKR